MNFLDFYCKLFSFARDNKDSIKKYNKDVESIIHSSFPLRFFRKRKYNKENLELIEEFEKIRIELILQYESFLCKFSNSNSDNLKEWINNIESFATFIIFADKVLVPLNNEFITVEYDNRHNTMSIKFKCPNYEVNIKYTATKINSSGNIALSMLNSSEDKLKMIDILINRTSRLCKRLNDATDSLSMISFVSCEEHTIEKKSDKIMIETIMSDINDSVIEAFNSALNYSIYNNTRVLMNIEEIFKHGFRL